ncbi:pumilio 24 [Tripterygium wilfordii]|uniref:Pumilio 24 n=1 Tax=Tripterygium wilfordii TaxID=458696 RepID=A0A7J7D286_TRIWF|nr:pumilio 24 [Tripterygium wilfordii]
MCVPLLEEVWKIFQKSCAHKVFVEILEPGMASCAIFLIDSVKQEGKSGFIFLIFYPSGYKFLARILILCIERNLVGNVLLALIWLRSMGFKVSLLVIDDVLSLGSGGNKNWIWDLLLELCHLYVLGDGSGVVVLGGQYIAIEFGYVVTEYQLEYQLGDATQRQELIMELYSIELQLFKDLVLMKESRLLGVISKLDLQKASVLRHPSLMIQPILGKIIVDHSIILMELIEYLTIAEKLLITRRVLEHSIVRMIHTRDGSRLRMLCVNCQVLRNKRKLSKE